MYYKVTVREIVEIEGKKEQVKEKKITLHYIVKGNSVTEAEACIIEYLGNNVDAEVVAIREMNIEDIIL